MTGAPPAPKVVLAEATCPHCHRPYWFDNETTTTSCGRVECRARTEWGPIEWAQHARFARIRNAAGLELSDLSIEALERAAS